jgi:hypothetical protein
MRLEGGAGVTLPMPSPAVISLFHEAIRPDRRFYLIKTRRIKGSFRSAWLTAIKPPDYKGFCREKVRLSLRTC